MAVMKIAADVLAQQNILHQQTTTKIFGDHQNQTEHLQGRWSDY
jgi:hypothetical protein